MPRYTILAQSETTTQRISKTVVAANPAQALRLVSIELHNASFYVVSITLAN